MVLEIVILFSLFSVQSELVTKDFLTVFLKCQVNYSLRQAKTRLATGQVAAIRNLPNKLAASELGARANVEPVRAAEGPSW